MPLTAAIFALTLAASALAGVPVQLPSTEEATAWEEVFELAGLHPGAPDKGAWARFDPAGDKWSLTVCDSSGQVSTMIVEPPGTYAERRSLAFLAASLVETLDLPEPEPEPEPEPPPPPPPPPEPEPEPVPEAPTEPPWFYVPRPVVEHEPAVQLTGAVHTGLSLRKGTALGARLSIHLGVDLHPPLRLGLVADLSPPTNLTALQSQRTLWTADLAGCLWWRHPYLRLGAGAGVGSRRFSDGDAPAGRVTVPLLVAEGVATLPLTGSLSLEPVVQIRQDLVGISLLEELEPRGKLGSTSLLFGVGIGTSPRTR